MFLNICKKHTLLHIKKKKNVKEINTFLCFQILINYQKEVINMKLFGLVGKAPCLAPI